MIRLLSLSSNSITAKTPISYFWTGFECIGKGKLDFHEFVEVAIGGQCASTL